MATILLFDIDGTLLATGGAGRKAMLAALSEEFGVAAPESLMFSGKTDRHLLTGLLDLSGQEVSESNVTRLRTAYGERLRRTIHQTRGAVLPGVHELLQSLQNHVNVTLGVLTGNAPETARLKLEHFGLAPYFRIHFFGDVHPLRTELASFALASLRNEFGTVHGHQICLIGDTPMDIEAAQAIGARSLATATGVYDRPTLISHGADLAVDNLTDTEYLTSWLASAAVSS